MIAARPDANQSARNFGSEYCAATGTMARRKRTEIAGSPVGL